MNTFTKLIALSIIFLISSCASHEKTLQFQVRLQKIIASPEIQEELFKCYTDLLKKNRNAEGHVIIKYTFLSETRKDITFDEVSPNLNDQTFTNCLVQKAETVDIRSAYSAADSDTIYRGIVLGSYSFKNSITSPKR